MQHSKDWAEGEVILIDKPLHWTSFDVVNKLRHALQIKKIGHAGTLDPLATGLLILCTGKKTKQIDLYQAKQKTYLAEFHFGFTTPSYDAETEVNATFDVQHISIQALQQLVDCQFTGKIKQFPPKYSAIKQNGKKLYELARKGKEVKIEAREVEIHRFSVLSYENQKATCEIVCSKGTYIRSLAHDIGSALHSGAYLSALRRTHIGNFSVDQAMQIPDFIELYRVAEERKF